MSNNQNHYFKGSIGNKKIFEVPIKSFQSEVKNVDWVENKLYKPAVKVVVRSVFDKEKDVPLSSTENVLLKANYFKSLLEVEISSNPKISNVSYFKKFLFDSYLKNEKECSKEFQALVKILVENVSLNEKETLLLLNSNFVNKGSQEYLEIMTIMKKYRNSLLKTLPYQVIEGKELEDLKKYLNNLDKDDQEDIKDTKSFNRGISDDFSLFIDESELKKIHSIEIKDQSYSVSLLVNELKSLINDNYVSNEYCLDLLIQSNHNTREAAKKHFYNKYKSDKLTVIYVLPSGEERKEDLELMSDSQNIYTQAFILCPELDNPKLFYLGKEFNINFLDVVYIGGMNLNQNIRIMIKK
jgi:hypothetical protein